MAVVTNIPPQRFLIGVSLFAFIQLPIHFPRCPMERKEEEHPARRDATCDGAQFLSCTSVRAPSQPLITFFSSSSLPLHPLADHYVSKLAIHTMRCTITITYPVLVSRSAHACPRLASPSIPTWSLTYQPYLNEPRIPSLIASLATPFCVCGSLFVRHALELATSRYLRPLRRLSFRLALQITQRASKRAIQVHSLVEATTRGVCRRGASVGSVCGSQRVE